MSKWFQISGRFRRMIRPFTAVHLCYIMLSLSVNLMGWAPQKIKCTHKKICWGLTPFYFRFAWFFLCGPAPSFSWGTPYEDDSPRELPWTLQQLQPTAATSSLAAETDITSYRVHERPRWVWNKRIHRMQKNSTNIEINEKPIRAVSWWASIVTSHNKNGFPASASLCVFS